MKVKVQKRVDVTGVKVVLTMDEVAAIRKRLVTLHHLKDSVGNRPMWSDCPALDAFDDALIDAQNEAGL